MIEDKDYLNHIKKVTGSDSLCLAKWYNATIWLGSGQTTSCHHPPAHQIDVEAVKKNPAAIHNTDQKKMDRLMMQNGERPAGCSYCWRLEDMGQVSDRVYKTKIHDVDYNTEQDWSSNSTLEAASKIPFTEDVNLKTLEISFDRTCQFACSYCNPAFSTTWVKDIKKNGPYECLTSDGRNHFTHTHDAAQPYKVGEENPYVEAFWKWWDSDLKHTLKEIRITGGEPTMSADFWKFLDKVHSSGSAKRGIKVAFNSNLGCRPEDIKKLKEFSSIMFMDLYTSCESVGAQAEYIRDGLDFDIFMSRLDEVIYEGHFQDISVMCTINALCLWGLTDFLDMLLMWRSKDSAGWKMYDQLKPSFTLNILRFPSFQSCLVLPEELRKTRRQVLEGWLWAADEQLLHRHEIDHIQRLIEYLREPEPENVEQLRRDFKNFYTQYDLRRNKSFENTFPEELVEWFSSL